MTGQVPTVDRPNADFFRQQLDLLRSRNAPLADAVERASLDALRVEPTRTGRWMVFLESAGRSIALHSKYDPVGEADGFVSSALAGAPGAGLAAVVGFGLGYHAEAAYRRTGSSTPLLLFEDRPDVLSAALTYRDLTELLRSPRVAWFGSDPDDVARQLLPNADALPEEATYVVAPVTEQRSGDYLVQARKSVDDLLEYGAMLRTTKRVQGRRTIANVVGNLERYAGAESLEPWRGRWTGRPALVVSAGPSLVRNRHLLPRVKGRMLLIVVATALKQVLALGVEPDVVVHIDHSDLCLRHLDGIGNPGRMVLLAEASASPVVLSTWHGRLAMPANGFADLLLGERPQPLPELPQGTSVAHTAFYAAEYFGADPIVFAGQDLAFTDGVYYSPGNGLHELWRPELNRFHTAETKEWERLVRRRPQLLTVEDQQGRPLMADRQMNNYRQQFERDFARSSATVIDASEGGAAKRGAHPMTLLEVIERHAGEPFPETWTESTPDPDRWTSERVADSIRQTRLAMLRFQRTMDEAHTLQRRALERFDDEAAFADDMDRVGRLQQRVQTESLAAFRLVAAFEGGLEFDKARRTREIDAADLSPAENLRHCIDRDAIYVLGLRDAAGELARLLEDR